MKMYQQMGINSACFLACDLIQFPIIIGLYQAISRLMASNPTEMASIYDHVYPS